ncbi:MAG: hypothetical protein CMJ83_02135 [Planctomycetes bacterium]|nr:hypothetical protein [Planctomycetota bacterium]
MNARDLVGVGLLALLVGLLVAPVLLTDKVYLPRHSETADIPWATASDRPADLHPDEEPINYVLSDKFNLVYPDMVYGLREAQAGHLPEWNPNVLGGVPHAANPLTAVFYPPNWIALLVDPWNAPLAVAALHVFFCGLFLYLFLRMCGLRPFAAIVGGAAFALSGWVAAHLQNTPLVATVAWWPAALFAVEARLRGHGRWSLMTLSLALAMMWLAGFPQLAVLGTLMVAIWALIGIVARVRADGGHKATRHAGGLLVFAMVGGLLASVQLLPTFELMRHSGHQDASADSLVDQRFRIGGWSGMLMPEYLGGPDRDPGLATHWGATLVLGEGPTTDVPSVMNWSERTFYPGILVLALAFVGILYARGRAAWSLVGVGVLGGFMASSEWIIRGLSYLPGFDVGAPARAIVIPAFAIAALAGFGFHVLLEWRVPKLLKSVRFVTLATGVPLVMLALVVGWAFMHPNSILTVLVEVLKAIGVEESMGQGQALETEKYVTAFGRDFPDLARDLLRIFLVSGAGFCLLMVRLRRPHHAPKVAAAAAAIVVIDLLFVFVPANQPVSRSGLFRETAGIKFLEDHLGTDRFMRVSPTHDEALRDYGRLFAPNVGLLYGLPDAQGWREQVPQWYPELWRGVAAEVRSVGVSGIAADQIDNPVLDLARVRFLVARTRIPALENRLVFPTTPDGDEDPGMWIYENRGTLRRARVVHRARCLPDEEARELIRAGEIDSAEEVIIHQWPDHARTVHPVQEGVDVVTATRDDPGRLAFSLDTRGAGWLVVSDTWFPGWRAWVRSPGESKTQRHEVPVVRADTAFMAIPVDAGKQIVELEYVPQSVTIGVVLTALGWIGLLLLPLVHPGGHRARNEERSPAPTEPDANDLGPDEVTA